MSAARLKSIVDRIERINSEIDAANADKADIFKEAKSDGWIVPALKALIAERRKQSKDPVKFDELAAMVETYRAALESGTGVATRAGARQAAGGPRLVAAQ